MHRGYSAPPTPLVSPTRSVTTGPSVRSPKGQPSAREPPGDAGAFAVPFSGRHPGNGSPLQGGRWPPPDAGGWAGALYSAERNPTKAPPPPRPRSTTPAGHVGGSGSGYQVRKARPSPRRCLAEVMCAPFLGDGAPARPNGFRWFPAALQPFYNPPPPQTTYNRPREQWHYGLIESAGG